MAGDGVSLPTTIVQSGSVAKTQARGMQQSPTVTPFSDRADKQDDLRVQRVQETKEQENRAVDPDRDQPDKRQRRRHRRNRKLLAGENDESAATDDEAGGEEPVGLGSLVDLHA